MEMCGIKMKMKVVLAPLHTTRKKTGKRSFQISKPGPAINADPLLERMFKAYNEPNGRSLKIS